MTESYIVRFEVAGVWNGSDPFRTAEEADEYAEHLNRRGGVYAEVHGPIAEGDEDVNYADADL